jgi:hypothetical protein
LNRLFDLGTIAVGESFKEVHIETMIPKLCSLRPLAYFMLIYFNAFVIPNRRGCGPLEHSAGLVRQRAERLAQHDSPGADNCRAYQNQQEQGCFDDQDLLRLHSCCSVGVNVFVSLPDCNRKHRSWLRYVSEAMTRGLLLTGPQWSR